jgi:hypothetical protein
MVSDKEWQALLIGEKALSYPRLFEVGQIPPEPYARLFDVGQISRKYPHYCRGRQACRRAGKTRLKHRSEQGPHSSTRFLNKLHESCT